MPQRIEETIDWLLREMVVDTGGVRLVARCRQRGRGGQVLCVVARRDRGGARRRRTRSVFAEIYDVTAAGNFEGHNILNRLGAIALRDADDRGAARVAAREAAGAARDGACGPASTTRCWPTGTA